MPKATKTSAGVAPAGAPLASPRAPGTAAVVIVHLSAVARRTLIDREPPVITPFERTAVGRHWRSNKLGRGRRTRAARSLESPGTDSARSMATGVAEGLNSPEDRGAARQADAPRGTRPHDSRGLTTA